jgi:endonuclease-3
VGKRAQVQEVLDRLEASYGVVRHVPRFSPMEELISCILSQHTADAKSFPTFTLLLEAYPTWAQMAMADPAELAAVIAPAGLSNQKAKSILGTLAGIERRFGRYDLDALRDWPVREARTWLQTLPGVGPKTASIVLSFALGKPAIPVDTHVYRVAVRLRLIAAKLGEVKAHDALLRIVRPQDCFRFHALLIQHGRALCRAPRPLCASCPLLDLCPARQVG